MLENGRTADVVYERSVQKILSARARPEKGCGRMGREDGFLVMDGRKWAAASATETGYQMHGAAAAVHQAVNRLMAAGGISRMMTIQFTVPAGMDERELKALSVSAAAAAGMYSLAVVQSDAAAVSGLSEPVVTATVMGRADELFETEPAAAGQDLIMAGYAGWQGALKLYGLHGEKLESHFNRVFLSGLAAPEPAAAVFSAAEAVKAASRAGVRNMYAAGEGGIFTAVWELARRENLGARVHLKSILLRQETVELCDYFNISPYQLLSAGVLLMAANHGQQVLTELAGAGIPAAIIGHLTDDNDRVILNEDEVRYLEPFRQDSINTVQQQ